MSPTDQNCPRGFKILYREDLKRGVGMVRGQLVSPTATLVVGEVDRLALGKHLKSFVTDQFL